MRKHLPALIFVISLAIAAAVALPGGVTAHFMFQSSPGLSPVLTPPTPTPTKTFTQPTRLPPTLLPPTLVPTLTPTRVPTATPTATATATATPTLAPDAKTATAAARAYLPPPTLTSPGMLPPVMEARPNGPGGDLAAETREPLSDLPIRSPTPEPTVLDRFIGNDRTGAGYIWLCFGVLLLVGGSVGAVLLLRYKP